MSYLYMIVLIFVLALITGCAPRECFLPNSNYTCEPFEISQ